jgi:hypothetical protein
LAKPQKLKRVVLKEELVELTGDPIEAIILNQCLYWNDILEDMDKETQQQISNYRKLGENEKADKLGDRSRNGWFYKKAQEMQEEIMISTRATVDRKMKKLHEKNFLLKRKNPKSKMDRTNHWKVNVEFLQQELHKIGYSLDGYALSTEPDGTGGNPSSRIAQNEQSSAQNEQWNAQSEQSSDQYEQWNAHHEQTIPEITSEITSEITNTEITNSSSSIHGGNTKYSKILQEKTDDDEKNKSPQILIYENRYYEFLKDFLAEKKIAKKDIASVIRYCSELGIEKFSKADLEKEWQRVLYEIKHGSITAFGKFFAQGLDMILRNREIMQNETAATVEKGFSNPAYKEKKAFPYYNWLNQ